MSIQRTRFAPRRRPRRLRPAYTLLELVMALGVVALVLIGAQSAVLLATRALPDRNADEARALAAAQALELMSMDIGDATAVSRATGQEIEIVVPDRDGDGKPETIRYDTLAPDAPQLRRIMNGAKPRILIDKLASLALSYETQALSEPGASADGPETLLAAVDAPSALPATISVFPGNWVATSFRPKLPADAVSWTVTRFKIRARASGTADSQSLVQVRDAFADLPAASVLDEVLLDESALPAAFAWQDVALGQPPRFAPGQAAAIVIRPVADSPSMELEYQPSGVGSNDVLLATSPDAGSVWLAGRDQAILFYAYGRIATPGAPLTAKLLSTVRIAVDLDDKLRVQTSVRVPNRPRMDAP